MPNEHNKSHGSAHQHGKINYLESTERRAEFSPEQLLSRIPLKKTDNILDFGAGTGYMTIPAAKRVDGTVFALDIDPSMLKIISQKAAAEQLANIVAIQGGSAALPVANASIDIVIASLVLHEISPLTEVLNGIHKVLKQNGCLVVVEIEPQEHSAHKAPRISLSGMEQEIADAGLRLTEKFFPSESLYVLIAEKTDA
ncbi:class I SAM-dependent methyltransferase [Planococcus sp. CPCC 101016]|uniref:class I SAM-dependent methyltransferase n=1 Tax=Planococcus sp. CPCC 101016 TaxID=2599617 RepID=UPI0021BD027A|nr:class I SAM-dependent methyltransferase [Planococcus sp. CPCC 101016]